MQAILLRELDLFRETRDRTIAIVSGLAQPQLDFSPSPRKWSVGEIAGHLLLGEKMYREQFRELIELAKSGRTPEIRRSTRDINFSPGFLPKALLPALEIPFTVMNFFVPSSVREALTRYVVMPSQHPDSALPEKGARAEDLRRDLKRSMEETAAVFEANPGLDYTRMIFRHPLLGSNTVPQLLRIAALHEQRHQGQMSGVIKDPRFPKG